jgi:hypothetical protein
LFLVAGGEAFTFADTDTFGLTPPSPTARPPVLNEAPPVAAALLFDPKTPLTLGALLLTVTPFTTVAPGRANELNPGPEMAFPPGLKDRAPKPNPLGWRLILLLGPPMTVPFGRVTVPDGFTRILPLSPGTSKPLFALTPKLEFPNLEKSYLGTVGDGISILLLPLAEMQI